MAKNNSAKTAKRAAKDEDGGGLGKGLLRVFYVNKVLASGMADAVSDGYDAFATAIKQGDGTSAALAGWLSAMDTSAISYGEALRAFIENGSKGSAVRKRGRKA